MRTWEQTFLLIARSAFGEEDEDFYNSTGPAVMQAGELARKAQSAGWPPPNWVTGMGDGGVSMAWCSGGNSFYLDAEKDGSVHCHAYQDGKLVQGRDEPWPA